MSDGSRGAHRPSGYASATTARCYHRQLALERAALKAAIELAAPQSADVVLDVGTGTGALLTLLARCPGRPRQVTGLDASEAMLRQAPPLPDDWRLIKADARRLPVPDASVDVVTCAYLLHLLDEPGRQAVLREAARVLAPRGRAVLVTLAPPGGLLGRSVLAPLQLTVCRLLGPGSGWCALDPRAELAGAGLRLLRGRRSTRGYASLCLLVDRA